MSDTSMLSQPLELAGGARLPNRLAKSAMSEVLGDVGTGAPTEGLVRLYERWGRGGAGLLVTGHVIVDRGGMGEPGNVLVEDERHLPMLRRWAEAAQARGSKLWMQLNHAGRQSPRRLTPRPVAPSAVAMKGFFGTFAPPRPLEDAEIEALVGRFAATAAVAQQAGFSGVQIHAAHGYLLSQFLSPLTNRRGDRWGGDLEGRMRMLIEVVRAVRAAVGPAFPVGVKLNSADFQRGGFELPDAKRVAQALEREGVALLEVSGGNYESPAMSGRGELPAQVRESTRQREAYFLGYAREMRAATRLPLMLTGGLRSAAAMAEAIGSGAIDVAGLARPLCSEPELPGRLLSGQSEEASAVRLHTGLRMVDDMLQVFWFQQQLHRMARGLDPDPGLGRWTALASGVRQTFLASPPRRGTLAPASSAA